MHITAHFRGSKAGGSFHFIGVYGNLTAKWTAVGTSRDCLLLEGRSSPVISFLPLQTPRRLESGDQGESSRSSMVRVVRMDDGWGEGAAKPPPSLLWSS